MDLRSPTTQRWILISLGVFAGIYVYLFTTYAPICLPVRAAELKRLHTHEADLGRQVRDARLAAQNLPHLEDEVAALHARWEVGKRLIPEQLSPDDVLRAVSVAAQEADVTVGLVRPGQPNAQEMYTIIPASLEVSGRYADLGLFVAKLAAGERLLTVPSMRLTAIDTKTPGGPTVKASLDVRAYTVTAGGTR